MKQQKTSSPLFLPTNREEMEQRNWDELDVLFITGDAYIDHPAFGTPLLARLLEAQGYRTGIIAQPDWKNHEAFKVMGRPRLFAAISGGAMDSMVNHYTAARKIRRNDAYTPGGIAGKRPNRAVIAYTAAVKGAFKGLPTVIGGIEASLRRLAHYDYWSDKVRRSVLIDSKANLLLFGMAETAILEVTRRLDNNEPLSSLTNIRGSAYSANNVPTDALILPGYEEIIQSTDAYNLAFKQSSHQDNPFSAKVMAQPHADRYVVINPPALPLSESEMDTIYALPFTKRPHPMYREKIPAFEQIRNSITSHRGCFGGCSFCAITHHQGKTIQSRSQRSILNEVDALTKQKEFRGTISDVGGPTANMYGLKCGNHQAEKVCQRPSCLYPAICVNLITDDQPATTLLKEIRQHNGIKHTFVASGVRYDLFPEQQRYFADLLQHHVGGLLKVAPESTSDNVTAVMRKPGAAVFTRFLEQFRQYSRKLGRKQAVVPYLISNHPGCTLNDMIDVALYLKRHHLTVEQVQDFTPTPGSLSTCIYHTGKDPFSGQPVHVPRSAKERRLQKSLLLYHRPEFQSDIKEALKICHREDVCADLLGSVLPKNRHKKGIKTKNGNKFRRDKP